jgi:hypothetical protein
MGMGRHRGIGSRHQKAAGHAQMYHPLCPHLAARIALAAPTPRVFAEGADDMLARALNAQDDAAFESLDLFSGRGLEWLRIGAEPDLDDTIATHAPMNAARNRLNLRKFWHPLILVFCLGVDPECSAICVRRLRECDWPRSSRFATRLWHRAHKPGYSGSFRSRSRPASPRLLRRARSPEL